MTHSATKPHDELSDSEQSGWNVRSAEPGDTLTVERPPDDFETEMVVLEKTETEWTTTLLVRPERAPEGSNPAELKTVKMQTTSGLVDRDDPGAWNGPTMAPIHASKVSEPKWVRVWTGDES